MLAFQVLPPRDPNTVFIPSLCCPSALAFVLSCKNGGGFLTSRLLFVTKCLYSDEGQGVLPEGLSFGDICYQAAEPFTAKVSRWSTRQKGLDLISLFRHHLHLSGFLPHR